VSSLTLALGILTLAGPTAAPVPAYPPNAVGGGVVVAILEVVSGRVGRVAITGGQEPFASSARGALAGWRFPASIRRAEVPVVVAFRSPNLALPGGSGDLPVPASARPANVPFPTRVLEPAYPPNMLGDGAAIVRLGIDAGGNVREAAALGQSGGLASACLDAARQWRFAPAVDLRRQPAASEAFAVCVFRAPVVSTSSPR
jgi:hypothetical protein